MPAKNKQTVSLNKDSQVIELDAAGYILGRLATKIAILLQGKNQVSYQSNRVSGAKVLVKNASAIQLSGKKWQQKIYFRHSGYLGNLKSETAKELLKRRPEEILRRAVQGMLPKNRLRKIYLRNLIIQK